MINTPMYNFCFKLKISPHSWHFPPQDFSLADMMRVFFFSDAHPITWINIGGFWNCIHLHRTLVNPLDLIHKSPTLSAGEKGFGWGMLHSIADEKSNWGDFAAARHGMGVWVLEPAKPCPSPPGASKASLFAPFLTNQRKLVSFFCPFRCSLPKPYFSL